MRQQTCLPLTCILFGSRNGKSSFINPKSSIKVLKTSEIFSCHLQVVLSVTRLTSLQMNALQANVKISPFPLSFELVKLKKKKLSSTCATFEFQNRIKKKTRKAGRRESGVPLLNNLHFNLLESWKYGTGTSDGRKNCD